MTQPGPWLNVKRTGRELRDEADIKNGGDADNVRCDAAAKRMYVAAVGGLYGVDPSAGKVVGRVPIVGHAESFQFEAIGIRAFASLPSVRSSQVIAGDRKSMT